MMTGVRKHEEVSARQRLYVAVARWNVETGSGLVELIDSACRGLIDGLDSPALRELAGASANDSSWDLRQMVTRALQELDIPRPGAAAAVGFTAPARAGLGVDSLRLSVAPESAPAGSGFQVQVFVNEVEMTGAGAGLGMDPYDLLVPTNRLVAGPTPRTIPVARCTCGVYGCGSTDVTIVRDGDLVHWEWSREAPMPHGASFTTVAYDAEMARIAADHSWETPDRTAGRLVLARVDPEDLARHGLQPEWVGPDHRDPDLFQIAFRLHEDYQVFVAVAWHGRSPEELARDLCTRLASPPRQWQATWHALRPDRNRAPAIAGPRWKPARF